MEYLENHCTISHDLNRLLVSKLTSINMPTFIQIAEEMTKLKFLMVFWRHMNTFFRSWHTFTTRFLATICNPLYPLPSVFPNTCSIPPFLLYLANHSSDPDILSTYSKPRMRSTQP